MISKGTNLRPVHPRVANEVQIEKIIDSINAPGPLTRSRATQLANFCGHFAFVSISEPKKVAEAFMEPEWIQAMQEKSSTVRAEQCMGIDQAS